MKQFKDIKIKKHFMILRKDILKIMMSKKGERKWSKIDESKDFVNFN